MSRPRLIAITGPDGSGKSTLCKALAEKLHAKEISIWDALDGTQGLLFRSKQDAMKYLSSLDSLSRILFLFHAMAVALDRGLKSESPVLLLNGYWYKYAVSELGYGADWKMLRAIASGFPKPDLVIYLGVPSEMARARKTEVSSYEMGREKSFVSFQESLRVEWERVKSEEGPWVEVSGEQHAHHVLSQVERKIWEAFPNIKPMQ